MKKSISAFLAFILALTLVACEATSQAETDTPAPTAESSESLNDNLTEEQRAEVERYLEEIREEAMRQSAAENGDDGYDPPTMGWSDDVSYGVQVQLSMIAEDMAKQAAQNPSTVDMKTLTMGFAKNGHYYAVQSDFDCSNLMGVSESHTIKVMCKTNKDESKIQVYEVWLDDVLVASYDENGDPVGG